MRIVHAINYAGEERGGAQKIVHELYRAAPDRTRIIAFDYMQDRRGRVPSSKSLAFRALLRELVRPDTFIFVHHRIMLPVVLLRRSRSAFVGHNMFPDKNAIYRYMNGMPCIAVSEEVRGYLLSHNPHLQVAVIPNGLVPPPPDEMNTPESDGVLDVAYVGRLAEAKGVDLLFEAWCALKARYGNTHLHIVGAGPLGEMIATRAQSMGIASSVTLYSYSETPFRLIKHADLLCVPSRFEGCGLVFYEALGRDHLVLASNLPVFHAFDWDERTLFFETGSVQSLLQGLERARERAGRPRQDTNGRARHRLPTTEAMVSRYLSVAEELGHGSAHLKSGVSGRTDRADATLKER